MGELGEGGVSRGKSLEDVSCTSQTTKSNKMSQKSKKSPKMCKKSRSPKKSQMLPPKVPDSQKALM